MTTVVNNPGPERVVQVERPSDAGWAVAVIVLIIVIAIGAWAWNHYRRPAPASNASTNINVTLPTSPANGTPTEGQ